MRPWRQWRRAEARGARLAVGVSVYRPRQRPLIGARLDGGAAEWVTGGQGAGRSALRSASGDADDAVGGERERMIGVGGGCRRSAAVGRRRSDGQ